MGQATKGVAIFEPGVMSLNSSTMAGAIDTAAQGRPQFDHVASKGGVPLRVLIYEDNPADVELALWTLNSAGFEITSDVATTQEAALARARERAYDLILADYRVPGGTGMDLFRALREAGIAAPFILVTGSLGDEAAVECLKEGVADYVLKDRLVRLPVAVRRALAERRLQQARIEAEEMLRASANSYRSLVESAPCGILRLSAADGRFLEVNGALAQMLGYGSPAEMLSCSTAVHQAMDIETCARVKNECGPGDFVREIDIEWKSKDGAPLMVRLSGRLMRNEQGTPISFELIAENVTARRRAEERIRQLNRLYSVSTQVSQAIVRIRNREELFQEICRIAVEEGQFRMAWVGILDRATSVVTPVCSWGAEEGYLKAIKISAVDEPCGRAPVGSALREGEHFVCCDTATDPRLLLWREEALSRGYRSVAVFPFSVHRRHLAAIALYASQPNVFDDENVALLDKLAADVSFALESMESEHLRQQAVDELNQFFTLSPDMLCIAGMDGHIRRLNPACEKTLGVRASESTLMSVSELVHPQDLPLAQAAVRKLQAGAQLDGIEIRVRTRDGSHRWFICNAIAVSKQRLIFAAARDISEHKRLEDRLRQQYLEVEETNRRVEAASRMKSEFLANMSHELRSPLNGIVGFSELIYDGRLGPVTDSQKDLLGRVLQSAKHLLQLINGILDLSKVEAGRLDFHPETLSPLKLVQEVTGILSGLAAAKLIRIETTVEPKVATVAADPARLKQVLYNYLSNALKFTGEAGLVTVNVKAEGASEFRLEVADTGVGIAPQDIEKLFIEFQQLDSGKAKRYQGTGLGLALTKRIVEAQGGRVGVKSTPGQGSTFFAILPRAAGSSSVQRSDSAARVLVIEDERTERIALSRLLEKHGMAVETAATCAEALAKVRSQSFDVITLDLLLPDRDGRQILEAMQQLEQNRQAAVIVVSMVEEADTLALPGVRAILRKPISHETLLAALERAGVRPSWKS